MSFGFSISDFVTCAQLARQIYDALKTGPTECQAFAEEILLFQEVLMKVGEYFQDADCCLGPRELRALSRHFDDCQELLCSTIMGSFFAPDYCEALGNTGSRESRDIIYSAFKRSNSISRGLMVAFRERIRTAGVAKKIPNLRHRITAQIEKLTAYNVLLMHPKLDFIRDSQQRTESFQQRTESSQKRVETAQERIEIQLEEILASQHGPRLLPNSLDASSPEGRQTWMNLGRILRREGITPAMIEDNQNLLIKAMKDTLGRDAALAESVGDSYRTAFEYRITGSIEQASNPSYIPRRDPFSIRPQSASQPGSAQLLSSGLPSAATFSPEFLQRHTTSIDALDAEENVVDGMNSLLEGMNGDHDLGNDFIEAEELTDADVTKMMHDAEDFPPIVGELTWVS